MKTNKKTTIIGTIMVTLAMVIGVTGCGNSESTTSQASNQKVEVKKVGTKRLEKAQDREKTLAKEKKDKEQEYQKLEDQLADQKEKEAEKKAEQQKQEKEAREKEKQAKAAAAKQAQERTKQSQDNSTSENNERGDMNTAEAGQIVGNVRSHIYHVPGQAGYRMNSSNAVYFNSEQDAINAGYRKALR